MNDIQMKRCAARIDDPATRERFERMMRRANELAFEAASLRRQAWSDWRYATGEVKRAKAAPRD